MTATPAFATPALLPASLIAVSAVVTLALGLVHLLYTFRGSRLHPRGDSLRPAMEQTPMRISAATTMWKAWVGFNASHSYGTILFSVVYVYLALAHAPVLLGSPFLLALGALRLAAYLHLAWRYWFRVPLCGIALAAVLYAMGLAALA